MHTRPCIHHPAQSSARPALPQLDQIPLHVRFLSAGTHAPMIATTSRGGGDKTAVTRPCTTTTLTPTTTTMTPAPASITQCRSSYDCNTTICDHNAKITWYIQNQPRKEVQHSIYKVGPGSTGYMLYTQSAREVQLEIFMHPWKRTMRQACGFF